jgi:uncharacterized delta-60 repeat protein
VTTHFTTTSDDFASGVAIQDDGRIVAAGVSEAPTSPFSETPRFALARYNPNGTLYTTFGGDGKKTTHFASGSEDSAYAVAIQDDGKIVAAGDSFVHNRDRFALARYNSNGTLDTSFGGDGKVTTRFTT